MDVQPPLDRTNVHSNVLEYSFGQSLLPWGPGTVIQKLLYKADRPAVLLDARFTAFLESTTTTLGAASIKFIIFKQNLATTPFIPIQFAVPAGTSVTSQKFYNNSVVHVLEGFVLEKDTKPTKARTDEGINMAMDEGDELAMLIRLHPTFNNSYTWPTLSFRINMVLSWNVKE